MESSRRERRAWALVALAAGLLLCAFALVNLTGVLDARRGGGRPGVAVVDAVEPSGKSGKGWASVRADVQVDGKTYEDLMIQGPHDEATKVGDRLDVVVVRTALQPTAYVPGRDGLQGAVVGAALGLGTAAYGLTELHRARPSVAARRLAIERRPAGRHRREDGPPSPRSAHLGLLRHIRRSA